MNEIRGCKSSIIYQCASHVAEEKKVAKNCKIFCVTLIDFSPKIKQVPQFLTKENSHLEKELKCLVIFLQQGAASFMLMAKSS